MIKVFRTIIPVFVMLLMVACKPSLPDGILDEDTMADMLYEIHLAHFIPDQSAEGGQAGSARIQLARQMLVLKEHDVSQEQWDASLAYYARHTELLRNVYNKMYEDVSGKAMAMGVSVAGIQQMGEDVEVDSTDIWTSADHFLLMSEHPYATQTWSVTPKDSVLNNGEKITLKFYAMFMNQAAQKRCTALMYVKLDNDSIIQATAIIGNTGPNSILITCPDSMKIKEIHGMFMMGNKSSGPMLGGPQQNNSAKILPQALLITRLHLLHNAPPKPNAPAKPAEGMKPADAPKNVPMEENHDSMKGKMLPPLHKELKSKQ